MNVRPIFSVILLLILANSSFGEPPLKDDDPKKILFVGNSYTGGISQMVSRLIKSSPHSKTDLTFVNPGGKTLAFHLTRQKTTDIIKEGNFDFVVLQDQSQTPAIAPDRFRKAAIGLDEIIDKTGAQTIFYQTWGRRDGDQKNAALFPDFDSMQAALSKSYRAAAKTCEANLAPVGDTWSDLRKKDPGLGRKLYQKDGSHPSSTGAYLAACVFYATLFGEDPRKLNFTGGLPEEDAKLIQELAHQRTNS